MRHNSINYPVTNQIKRSQVPSQPSQKQKQSFINQNGGSSQTISQENPQLTNKKEKQFYRLETLMKIDQAAIKTPQEKITKSQFTLQIHQNKILVEDEKDQNNKSTLLTLDFDEIQGDHSSQQIFEQSVKPHLDKFLNDSQQNEFGVLSIHQSNDKSSLLFGSKDPQTAKLRTQSSNFQNEAKKKTTQINKEEGLFSFILTHSKKQIENCQQHLTLQMVGISIDNEYLDLFKSVKEKVYIIVDENNKQIKRIIITSIRESCFKSEVQGNLNSLVSQKPIDLDLKNGETQLYLLFKNLLCGHSKLLILGRISNEKKISQNTREYLTLFEDINQFKANQKQLQSKDNIQEADNIIKSMPKHLKNPNFIIELPKVQKLFSVNHSQDFKASSLNQNMTKLVKNNKPLPKQINQNTNSNRQSPPLSPLSAQGKIVSRKSQNFEEAIRQIKSQQSLPSGDTTPDISHIGEIRQEESEAQMIKQLESQLLSIVQQEFQNQISVKEIIEKLNIQKEEDKKNIKSQKTLKPSKDSQKSQSLIALEQNKKKYQDSLQSIQSEKKIILKQLDLLEKSKKRQPYSLQEEEIEKDKQLQEMQKMIKDMSQKLQEKEKIIQQTKNEAFKSKLSLKELEETVQILKNNALLSTEVQLNDLSIQKDICKSTEKKKQSLAKKVTSGIKQNLTESSSQSSLYCFNNVSNQKDRNKNVKSPDAIELQGDKKTLEKKKNRSTANLFKWTKPTVHIKIAQEEKDNHNNSMNSGLSSQKNQHLLMSNNPKRIKQNKMSMVVSSSNFGTLRSVCINESSEDPIYKAIKNKQKKSEHVKNDQQIGYQEKENIKLDDIDEGVQNNKMAVVSVKSINNIMGPQSQIQSFDKNPLQKSMTNFMKINSPSEQMRRYTHKQKSSIFAGDLSSKSSLTKLQLFSIKQSSINLDQNKQPQIKSSGKVQRVKGSFDESGESKPQDSRISVEQQIFEEDDSNKPQITQEFDHLSKSLNEDLQNTPPRISQKMSELASKNKFTHNQNIVINQPRNKINITISANSKIPKDQKQYNTETCNSIYVINDGDRNFQEFEKKKKEKLDIVVRKSFELMNTLRSSADQAAMLRPIHRTRVSSKDRQNVGQIRNSNLHQQQSFTNYGDNQNSEITVKSPREREQIQTNENQTQMEYSRTLDSRPNPLKSSYNFQAEKKITNLKEARLRNRSSQSIHNRQGYPVLNQDENYQIKTANEYHENHSISNNTRPKPKANKDSVLQSQDLELKMNELDNLIKQQNVIGVTGSCKNEIKKSLQVLGNLHKCSSNDQLNFTISAQTLSNNLANKSSIDRPRSITIENQRNGDEIRFKIQQQQQKLNSTNTSQWGELANVIKRNLSPNSKEGQISTIPEECINEGSFINKYSVKYNRIDLCKATNQQSQQQCINLAKPPQNPQNNFKKRKNFENEDTLTENFSIQQLPQPTVQRGRSESNYLPFGNNSGMNFRTPRGHNPTQLGIQSPGNVLRNQSNSTTAINNAYFLKLKNQYLQNINIGPNTEIIAQQQANQSFQQASQKTCLMIQSNQQQQNRQLNNSFNNHSMVMRAQGNISMSAEFSNGFFTGITSPQCFEPIGRKDKAKPEVTELIEKQKMRMNSQTKKELNCQQQQVTQENNYYYPQVVSIKINEPTFK